MSIRTLTGQLILEASEGQRRTVARETTPQANIVSGRAGTPELSFKRIVTEVRRVSLIETKIQNYPIPGGVAARFKIKTVRAAETLVRTTTQSAPPESYNRSVDATSDDDTAPITIELQSH